MDVSQWWRAFLTTFNWNHDWKCSESLTLKASCIRNLFHQDRRWKEKLYCDILRGLRETSGVNVQASGVTTPGPCIMTTLWLAWHSCGSFWLLRRRQPSPALPTHCTSPPVIFSYSQRWNWSSRGNFWQHWRDPDWIAGHDEEADARWLPAVLPIMEIPLGSYQCQRGLLRRGWGRI